AASDTSVATALGVTVESYRQDLAHLIHVDVESLDREGAAILADEQEPVDQLADRRQMLNRVNVSLATLEPRDVTLLHLHYFEEKTFQEIATALGITSSRACQLLWRAVAPLRTPLGEQVMSEAA
ncbi:MAG: sigma factor-like helix-turn-helix DNA-binding protein, partial [Kofleriaceae bacterium]